MSTTIHRVQALDAIREDGQAFLSSLSLTGRGCFHQDETDSEDISDVSSLVEDIDFKHIPNLKRRLLNAAANDFQANKLTTSTDESHDASSSIRLDTKRQATSQYVARKIKSPNRKALRFPNSHQKISNIHVRNRHTHTGNNPVSSQYTFVADPNTDAKLLTNTRLMFMTPRGGMPLVTCSFLPRPDKNARKISKFAQRKQGLSVTLFALKH